MTRPDTELSRRPDKSTTVIPSIWRFSVFISFMFAGYLSLVKQSLRSTTSDKYLLRSQMRSLGAD